MTRFVWLCVLLLGSPAVLAETTLTVTDAAATEAKLDFGHTKALYFEHPLTIDAGDKPSEQVVVELPDLTHENGSRFTATFDPDRADVIPAKEKLRGMFRAMLPVTGVYSGVLVVRSKDQPELRYIVSITRDAAAAQIAVDDLDALVAQTGDRIELATNVRALGGKALLLERPAIRAKRHVADNVDVKASANIQPLSSATVLTAPTPMTFSITGLTEPAKYEAVVSFTPEEEAPVEKNLTIFVRRSMWCAGLWILAGILTSMALRWYWTRRRPRLMIERNYHVLTERITGVENTSTMPDVFGVIAAVRTQLQDAWNGLVLEDKWDAATTAFDVPRRKIGLLETWAAAQERVARMRPRSLVDALTAKLNPIAEALRGRTSTVDELAPHEKTMVEFPAVAKAEFKKAIGEAADTLLQLANDFDNARKTTIVAEITKDVDDARNASDEKSAIDAYDAAVEKMVNIVGAQLRDAVKKEDAALGKAVNELLDRATGERALDQLIAAITMYIRGAAKRVDDASRAVIEQQLAAKKIVDAWKTLDAALSPQKTTPAEAPLANGAAWNAERPRFLEPGVFAPITKSLSENVSAITVGDLLASVAAGLLAMLLGLKVLWFDNLSWGTLSDIAIALLWGAGLHGFTFDGMATLVAKLRGTTTTP